MLFIFLMIMTLEFVGFTSKKASSFTVPIWTKKTYADIRAELYCEVINSMLSALLIDDAMDAIDEWYKAYHGNRIFHKGQNGLYANFVLK